MDLQRLNDDFGLPGVLTFDEPHPGMIRAVAATPACSAELYLRGAHLTHWQRAGEEPVLFLSERSVYTPGKAIRGGVPVIFPWFGAPGTSPVHPPAHAPSHGFARTAEWQLAFAALAGEDLHLSLTLEPSDDSRAFGFGSFQLVYQVVLGRELTLRLSVANTATAPDAEAFLFEEALHAYLAVGGTRQVRLLGLADTDFLDKTDNFRRKRQTDPVLTLHGETDRPYLNTAAPITLEDPALGRSITVAKAGSQTTVIWNPGPELAATLSDLAPGAWERFTCVETANAAGNTITLRPREVHTMEARFTIGGLESSAHRSRSPAVA